MKEHMFSTQMITNQNLIKNAPISISHSKKFIKDITEKIKDVSISDTHFSMFFLTEGKKKQNDIFFQVADFIFKNEVEGFQNNIKKKSKTKDHVREEIKYVEKWRDIIKNKTTSKGLHHLDIDQKYKEVQIQNPTINKKTDTPITTTSDPIIFLDPLPIMTKASMPLSTKKPILVHVGQKAEQIASKNHADAVTIQDEIFMSKDKFDLSTSDGFGLIVHEIFHIDQIRQKNFDIAGINNSHEKEAIDAESKARQNFTINKLLENPSTNFNIMSNKENFDQRILFEKTDENHPVVIDEFSDKNSDNHIMNLYERHSNSAILENFHLSNISRFNNEGDLPTNSLATQNLSTFVFQKPQTIALTKNQNSDFTLKNNAHQTDPIVMTAEENRSIQSTPKINTQTVTEVPSISSMGIDKIANQVFEKISKRILLDRDRLGYR